MRNLTSGSATAGSRGLTSSTGAIAAALSFYPNFDRLTEAERENVRNDLVLMAARIQKANSLSSRARVELSPHVAALMNFVGLA